VAACLLVAPAALAADQSRVAPVVHAARLTSSVHVDGRLDDEAWRHVPIVTGFLQLLPDEGRLARAQTELQVAFDDDALYIAARLFDPNPERIVGRLSRRDVEADADRFVLYLDPHHDHLTGAVFGVTAAGVQWDATIYDDTHTDLTWDAVWDSGVDVEAGGWTVEMRIPFSQLRFPAAERLTWGLNAERIVQRSNETSWLALTPSNESGLASRMATLTGLSAIHTPRHLELLPYATARAEYIAPDRPGDPFNDGARQFGGVGMDLKYGLASNMTLSATVNPDFGQVEVDPAVVNLTAFETFYEEKRPFFTEAAPVFSRFARGGASDSWSFFYPEPQIFYSRRIGRSPQVPASGSYVDTPSATTILGATKLTGRTKDGWTVGLLEAVTGREYSKISDGQLRERVEAEPLTNNVVGRVHRELGARAGVGAIGTMLQRDLNTPTLSSRLVSEAYVGGADGFWFLDSDREWVVTGGIAGSHLSGSEGAIGLLQRASQRYFQRPNAPHVRFDPTRTSLSGWTGSVAVNRNRGNVTVNGMVWGMSPGFDSNDLGFATQTDRAGGHGLVLFRKLTPDRVTRSRQLWVSKWWTWNYGRELQGDGAQTQASLQFLNYWRYNLMLGWSRNVWDDKLTRGGPTVIRPGIKTLNTSVVSDTRKRTWFDAFGTIQERNFGSWQHTFGGDVNVRPSAAVSVSAGPSVMRSQSMAQYLATQTDLLATSTFGARYVFGELAQTELSMPTRVNVALSPRISLQAYIQPFISVGDYGAIKELARPRTYEFVKYGSEIGTLSRLPGSEDLFIDPDGSGPASPFRVGRPEFNVKSLRLNAVARWEFRPGSTAYFVWTRLGQDLTRPGQFDFGDDLSALWRAAPDDVILIKLSYWLAR
jgi:Domain of unknown function (DUF5916)/Carbohydrate family 9 binding domain-like